MVGIDYFTKWVKAISLVSVDQDVIINVFQSHIISIFKIPKTITTNQGLVFTGGKVVEFASK